MRKMLLVCFVLLSFVMNGFSQNFITPPGGTGYIQIVSTGTIEGMIGGKPCKVEGSCKSSTCDAWIECGCDETPKCDCGWISCSCDCKRKGTAISVLSPAYVENINSLMNLVYNSNNSSVVTIKYSVNELISSINARDYEKYKLTSLKVYNDIHNISNNDAKIIINKWFISRNIDDRI